jgi:transposase
MSRPNDLSRSFSPFDQQRTLVVVIEMSQSSWLVSGIVPGVDRQPLKKLDPDENVLLRLLQRWRGKAEGRGALVERTAVAFEAGRDGFWLARWLRSRGIEAHVRRGLSGAPSSQDRQARYRVAQAGFPRLASRRARAL